MSTTGKIHPEPKQMEDEWPIIIYDRSIHKSTQQLLYEAARANRETAKKLWTDFVEQHQSEDLSSEQVKVLIHNLDKQKQWAPIHYAVEANNIYVFNQLTIGEQRYRCNININGGNGENVLHIAARSENIWKHEDIHMSEAVSTIIIDVMERTFIAELPWMVRRLFSLGADVNDQDDEGRTPLHLAAQANRYNFVQELIAQKADVMALSKFRASVLFFALLPNSTNAIDLIKMVELILNSIEDEQKRHKLAGLATLDNQTPVALAVCHPSVTPGLVTKLLNEHADINEKQLLIAFDMAARYYKKKENEFEHLKSLLNRLNRLNRQETLKQLPHIFCRHNNVSLLKWYYDEVQGIRSNDNQTTRDSLSRDYDGYTPLLTAVFFKSKECVESLLKLENSICDRQNLLITNNNKENILHICAKREVEDDLLDILLNKSLDVYQHINDLITMTDIEGNTPLQVAVRFNNRHIYETILNYVSKSKNHNERLRLKSEAAHEASKQGHLDFFKLIVCSDSNATSACFSCEETQQIFQKRNKDGYTCLHLAAKQGHKEIVDFLINKTKIEIDPIGDRRQTPLHLACEKGYLKIVQLLLKAGASTRLRNAQAYNCLEIAIINQKKEVVQELFQHSTWREMMQNAQPIESTEAFDTPMRKLIRYMPDMTVWLIDNKLTQVVGGPGQKVYKTTYNYEFYEDMCTVKDWYTQDSGSISEPETCANLWRKRGVEAIHTCWCCCHSNRIGCFCCRRESDEKDKKQWYTNDAYTLVRNHPLFIVSEQWDCSELVQHFYHTHLRQTKLRSFGLLFFILSFFLYMTYMGLFTAFVLKGKHPKFFYDKAQVNMTNDLSTCEYVANYLTSNPNITDEVFKTETYKRIKWSLYIILSIYIGKNVLMIAVLLPKVLRVGGLYIEISALILSYVYILDWFDWQNDVIFRCPVQYQLGAMGLLLSYINILVYLRTSPIYNIGIYVVMLQVISFKFLRFLPVLIVIICGFGFTYWMLLQYQPVYGTPIEALIRTSLMLFDLGYEDRLYDEQNGGQGYYKLVYVMFILTAIACSIFVINLLIGLAVGEIPTLLTQGTLWRTQMLFNLLSDYEILRIRLCLAFDCLSCNLFRHRKIPWFRPRPYSILEKNELMSSMGKIGNAWNYTQKNFFHEQIQDSIKPLPKSLDEHVENSVKENKD